MRGERVDGIVTVEYNMLVPPSYISSTTDHIMFYLLNTLGYF